MIGLKWTLWNCGGIRAQSQSTKNKLDFFAKEFNPKKFSIAAFVETHLKQSDPLPNRIKLYSNTYHIVNEPTPTNETHAGILVLIHKDFEITNTQAVQPGRVLCIEITHKTSKKNTILRLSMVYQAIKQILKRFVAFALP